MQRQHNRLRFPVFSNGQIIFALADICTNRTRQIKKCPEPLKHSLDRTYFLSLGLQTH